MDWGVWRATVHGVSKSWTWLSDLTLSSTSPSSFSSNFNSPGKSSQPLANFSIALSSEYRIYAIHHLSSSRIILLSCLFPLLWVLKDRKSSSSQFPVCSTMFSKLSYSLWKYWRSDWKATEYSYHQKSSRIICLSSSKPFCFMTPS